MGRNSRRRIDKRKPTAKITGCVLQWGQNAFGEVFSPDTQFVFPQHIPVIYEDNEGATTVAGEVDTIGTTQSGVCIEATLFNIPESAALISEVLCNAHANNLLDFGLSLSSPKYNLDGKIIDFNLEGINVSFVPSKPPVDKDETD